MSAPFRDHHQASRAIRVLLSVVPRMDRLWTDSGPTTEAVDLCTARGGYRAGALSHRERTMLLAAFDLWNGQGLVPLAAILDLPPDSLEMVGALLRAIARGHGAIDDWLMAAERADESGERPSWLGRSLAEDAKDSSKAQGG